MLITLTLHDRSPAGEEHGILVLEDIPELITLEDLIRRRVRQEVEEYNRRQPGLFKGLVQPTETEATLNGYRLLNRRLLDWEKQAEVALQAFRSNRFFVLVGDRQVERLDEPLLLDKGAEVYFVKLGHLVGG